MKLTILNLLLITFISCTAQETPKLSKDSFDDLSLVSTRQFKSDALWGYMNGGADLYMEYGFENLTVQMLEFEEESYKAEIYKMKSPDAAFGIFSISRFNCSQIRRLHHFDCVTPFQYQAAKGEYYISVSNTSGSQQAQETNVRIAGKILAGITDVSVIRPRFFGIGILNSHINDLKLIKGELGMQNGFVKWDHLFSGYHYNEAWILSFEYEEDRIDLGWIRFVDHETMERFLKGNGLTTPDPAYLEPTDETGRYAFLVDDAFILFEGSLPEPIYYLMLNMYYQRF